MLSVYEMEQLLKVLDANAEKGLSLAQLAATTDIPVSRLQQFTKAHREYFVIMPDSDSYQLNRFGQLKGNIDAMLRHYQQRQTKKKTKPSSWIWLAVIFTTSMTLFTALHNQ
ncbi:hypothetical protein JYB87_17085 [Shewanella avicenniae]|uniref:Uncharacterized protein n=1 Tax=Shewanella avicenniae TaxID=2814294 RepID=A0ABX7QPL3_9GAMM|nr:hypothetical protein [Shewanella avicenniae]QSX33408.1 hypothetical protein JYB87_17085 [Shewanella avicenniae]